MRILSGRADIELWNDNNLRKLFVFIFCAYQSNTTSKRNEIKVNKDKKRGKSVVAKEYLEENIEGNL